MFERVFLLNPSDASDFLGVLSASGRALFGNDIVVDSVGNMYVVGQDLKSDFSDSRLYLAKFNSSGALIWQRNLGSIGNELGYDIILDSSNNIYVTGATRVSSLDYMLLAKYDSSGVIQWQRRLGIASGGGINSRGVAVDSSGNVYICGLQYDASYNETHILAKYDASGSILWQRQLPNPSGSNNAFAVAVDSSGNVYTCGASYDGTNRLLLVKYNSSGTLQWQRLLGGTQGAYGFGVSIDVTGNVYVCGYIDLSQGTFNWQIFVAKYDSSGNVQWQRTLNAAGGDYGYDITVDANSNVYVAGVTPSGGFNIACIAKYNTSGTLQWQRQFSIDSTNVSFSGIAVDAGGNPHAIGTININGYFLFVAKIPTDGSKTGTYTVGGYSITYSAAALTASTQNYTSSTSSFSSSASSLTASTTTISESAASYTAQVATL